MYQAVEHGKFINRGFLNGPYCPIYGVGVILVVGALSPISGNLAVLYAGSVILTSALELVTGFVLEKIFHQHWWDYSGERLNLHGYICLKFSLLWGVACLIVVRLIHPLVEKFVTKLPHTLGMVLIIAIGVGFVSDMVITVLAIVHIKNRLKLLDDISAQMRKISDFTGEKLYSGVENIREKRNELSEKNEQYRKKYEELREKYHEQLEKRTAVSKRIEKAFPVLKIDTSKTFREQLEQLRSEVNRKLRK